MVLKVLRDEISNPRGKMKLRWFGPFIIKKIMSGGATRIIELDGEEMLCQINIARLLVIFFIYEDPFHAIL